MLAFSSCFVSACVLCFVLYVCCVVFCIVCVVFCMCVVFSTYGPPYLYHAVNRNIGDFLKIVLKQSFTKKL